MPKTRSTMQIKHKKKTRRHLKAKCRDLKGEMEDITKEQNSITEVESQLGQKLTAIEMECQLLQEETQLLIQRRAFTQLRLSLVFNILKAREEGDLDKAAQITMLLREIIARDNMQQQTWRRTRLSSMHVLCFNLSSQITVSLVLLNKLLHQSIEQI